jgi:hypothetical protein
LGTHELHQLRGLARQPRRAQLARLRVQRHTGALRACTSRPAQMQACAMSALRPHGARGRPPRASSSARHTDRATQRAESDGVSSTRRRTASIFSKRAVVD